VFARAPVLARAVCSVFHVITFRLVGSPPSGMSAVAMKLVPLMLPARLLQRELTHRLAKKEK